MLFPKFYECVEAITYIAMNSGAKPVSSKDLCKHLGVMPRHFEPIMQQLVHYGILIGSKGPYGGYTLAREKRKITLSELFDISNLREKSKSTISNIDKTIIANIDKLIEGEVIKILSDLTIENLCKKIVSSAGQENKPDFAI